MAERASAAKTTAARSTKKKATATTTATDVPSPASARGKGKGDTRILQLAFGMNDQVNMHVPPEVKASFYARAAEEGVSAGILLSYMLVELLERRPEPGAVRPWAERWLAEQRARRATSSSPSSSHTTASE